jgi:hypothetical protein
LGGALARIERPRDGGVDQRVLEQLLRKLAQRVLALAGDPVAQPGAALIEIVAGGEASAAEDWTGARSRVARNVILNPLVEG